MFQGRDGRLCPYLSANCRRTSARTKFSVISAEGIAVSFTNAAGNIQSISPSNHCSGASASRGGFDSSTMIAYFIDQSGSRFGSGSKD